MAAAASISGRSSPVSATVTLTVPSGPSGVTTLTVPPLGTAAGRLQAALADPAQVASVADPRVRRRLLAELRGLDAFLAARPTLLPYRDHLWYVAHHAHPPVSPRRLAALLWCTVWFPHDCD